MGCLATCAICQALSFEKMLLVSASLFARSRATSSLILISESSPTYCSSSIFA